MVIEIANFSPLVSAQSTVATSSSSRPTSTDFQYKTFYSNGLYWVFYFDGTNITYKTSSDGNTWTAGQSGPIETTGISFAYQFSLAFDGANISYACQNGAGSSLVYRKGTCNSTGGITWLAAEQTVASSITATYPTICIDSNGFPWIGYENHTSTYFPYVITSSTKSGVWTTATGFPYDLNATDSNAAVGSADVVALTSGKVVALYGISGTTFPLQAKVWNGSSWGAETTTAGSAIYSATDYSAVAVGSNLNLVFLNGAKTAILYSLFNSTSNSFSAPTTLESGFSAEIGPVISVDTVTNNLFVFWEGYPLANDIYVDKYTNLTSSWGSPALWVAENGVTATYVLTCSASANSNGYVGLVYTNQTSNPYNVRFDPFNVNSVAVTFTSSPAGAGYITVNGTAVTTPYTVNFANPSDTYTVVANSPVGTVAGQSQYVYSSWNDSGAQTHSITISTSQTYTATFQLQYYLTVTGGNSPSGAGWVNSGSTTTASNAWIWGLSGGQRQALTNWQLDTVNQNPSRSNTGTFTTPSITMNTYHTAAFVSTTQYYLTVTGGNGITYGTPSPTSDNWYDSGTSTTVSSNWVWSTIAGQSQTGITNYAIDGSNQNPTQLFSGALTTSSVTMSTNHTVAFASTTQYCISPSNDANSVISPSTATWFNVGGFQDFTYSANSGYAINSVLVDGSGATIIGNYNFTNIQTWHSIAVTSIQTFVITASSDVNSIISPSGSVTANSGSSETFTISANQNYVIHDVYVDGSDLGAINSYTFNNIQANHTISVEAATPGTQQRAGDEPQLITPGPTSTPISTTDPNVTAAKNWFLQHPLYIVLIVAAIIALLSAVAVFSKRRY